MEFIDPEPFINPEPYSDFGTSPVKPSNGDPLATGEKYTDDIKTVLYWTYMMGLVVWFAIVIWLELYSQTAIGIRNGCAYNTQIIQFAIIAIPLFVFAVSGYNIQNATYGMESRMFMGDFLAFALLIIVVFVNWQKEKCPRIFKILMIAIILLMLSLIDIWTSPEYIIVMYHVRSILETLSLTLLVYALYSYYLKYIADEALGNGSGSGKPSLYPRSAGKADAIDAPDVEAVDMAAEAADIAPAIAPILI